jgi:uncharacterized LabA/DUF88 family protein
MRARFLVDGFNLYHSLKQAARDRCFQLKLPIATAGTKWFDLRRYCHEFVANELPRGSTIEKIQYFSAFATHLQARHPDVVSRHRVYVECLEDQGVEVLMGRFKEITGRTCDRCHAPITRHEEKETDVAIAAELMGAFAADECDIAVLVSGDTDMAPVVRTASRVFPTKKVGFLFPYRRTPRELKKLSAYWRRTSQKECFALQLADPYTKSSGVSISKPPLW